MTTIDSVSSKYLSAEALITNALPPLITNNPHKRILPDQISGSDLELLQRARAHPVKANIQPSLEPPHEEPILQPIPMYPMAITWSPDVLYFQLEEKPITGRLWVWNLCKRSIYVHCCGLWDETVRLNASWRCYPRTRALLASGLKAEILVKATPRHCTPAVKTANCGLQIAAQHLRDNVTVYYMVPMKVDFLKYIPLDFGE